MQHPSFPSRSSTPGTPLTPLSPGTNRNLKSGLDGTECVNSVRFPLIPRLQMKKSRSRLTPPSLLAQADQMTWLQYLRQGISTEARRRRDSFGNRRSLSSPSGTGLRNALPQTIFPLTPDWWEVDHGVIPKRNVRTPERVRKVDSSLDKRRQQFESLCLIAEERRRISDITKSRQFHLLNEFIESSERDLEGEEPNSITYETNNRNGELKDHANVIDGFHTVQALQDQLQGVTGSGEPDDAARKTSVVVGLNEHLNSMELHRCECEEAEILVSRSCRYCLKTFKHKPHCPSGVNFVWPRCANCNGICDWLHEHMTLDNEDVASQQEDTIPTHRQRLGTLSTLFSVNTAQEGGDELEMSVRSDSLRRIRSLSDIHHEAEVMEMRQAISSLDYHDVLESPTEVEIIDMIPETDHPAKDTPTTAKMKDHHKKAFNYNPRQAYIAALAAKKAQQLMNHIKHGGHPNDMFDRMLTSSFTFSYFPKLGTKRSSTAIGDTTEVLGSRSLYLSN